MPMPLLDALIAGDRPAAGRLAPYRMPADFPSAGALKLVRYRRDQIANDASWVPWSLRAIVLREATAMVGYVNFHGPPGVNDTATPNAVELGWTVFPGQRRKGYATETARALMDWAATEHGIRRFVSSTTPDNAPSLRVHDKLGFARTGQVVDGEIIFELRR
ncbi:MAG: GNAT family N-acetyltransferase [Chloroflexi bacterium]|nr:MAG: GNAT family N-acetyltransferase [Chloroflexota bacterium]TMF74430.1 MAG: GNAT family N-acetyltransferase [Chloroflexota bacterium]